jgi:hypothetical protein
MTSAFLSQDQIARILDTIRSQYPGWESFDHPEFVEDEISYKRKTIAKATDMLSASELQRLLAGKQYDEILKRLETIGRDNNLLYQAIPMRGDLGILYDGRLDKQQFCVALIDLLHGRDDSPERLDRYLAWVKASGLPNRWTFPTYFLFICHPNSEIFVKPGATARFLSLIGWKGDFRGGPTAALYDLIRKLAHQLRKAFAHLGARDMVDIQSLIWVCGQKVELLPAKSQLAPPSQTFSDLLSSLRSKGLEFSDEIVSNYLLALQSRRFVILAGIAGTGKTRLALEVARFFQPADNYVIEAVRPDWTDHRGLLGYFNPLTGRYVSTPFLDLLLRAGQEADAARAEGLTPQPFFAILDEMNLARVEHYFSDFLSALESGEPLRLHEDSGELGGDGPIPRSIEVPENLFFTGTVNVDESTYMFSPKVLDRAFTLELNEVNLSRLSEAPAEPGNGLRLDRFSGLLTFEGMAASEPWGRFGDLLDGDLRRTVLELNDLLTAENRHFGYRVAGEIARFVELAAEQSGGGESDLRSALDLALLQKVLPKFHGTQQEMEEVLDDLFRFAVLGRKWTTDDRDPIALTWTVSGGVLRGEMTSSLPRFALKVWRMRRRLERQGFTSFIE